MNDVHGLRLKVCLTFSQRRDPSGVAPSALTAAQTGTIRVTFTGSDGMLSARKTIAGADRESMLAWLPCVLTLALIALRRRA